MLAVPVLSYLQFAVLLDDTGHATFAPLSTWRGAMTDLPEVQAREVYDVVQGLTLDSSRGAPFLISRLPPSAPLSHTFQLSKLTDTGLSRTVQFDALFPAASSGSEPLLTAGNIGDGFFVYAEYLPAEQARLKFNFWGSSDAPASAVFSQDKQWRRLKIATDLANESLEVFLDDKSILKARAPVRADHFANAEAGLNHIGGGLTTPAFTGMIRNVSGL
jgi:hypothetical protein